MLGSSSGRRRTLSLPRPLAQGALEGKITANRIYQSAMNGGLGPAMEPSPSMTAFSKVNDEWIASMTSLSAQSTAADKAYWHHVNLINLQMRGLWEGYSAAAKASKGALPALKWESILYMNLGDELGDFAGFKPGLGFERPLPTFGDLDAFEEAGKCSALIKLLEDGSDIFIAQETWTSFDSMLRIYKMCTQPSPWRWPSLDPLTPSCDPGCSSLPSATP